MAAPDLTGQQFGAWRVCGPARSSRGGLARWWCRCACGTCRAVTGVSLRSGVSSSCGCGRRRPIPPGTMFGRLTVVGDAGVDAGHYSLAHCVCTCGGTVIVRQSNLQFGRVLSCGCLVGSGVDVSAWRPLPSRPRRPLDPARDGTLPPDTPRAALLPPRAWSRATIEGHRLMEIVRLARLVATWRRARDRHRGLVTPPSGWRQIPTPAWAQAKEIWKSPDERRWLSRGW